MAENSGAEGELAGNIASDHGGILAMNANGFLDPNGGGDGSQLAGWCMSNGEGYGTHFAGEAYQRIEQMCIRDSPCTGARSVAVPP